MWSQLKPDKNGLMPVTDQQVQAFTTQAVKDMQEDSTVACERLA